MATVKVHTYHFCTHLIPTLYGSLQYHTEHIVHCKVSPLRFPTLYPGSPRAFKSSYFLNPESFLYHKDIPFAFLCIYGCELRGGENRKIDIGFLNLQPGSQPP